MKKLPQGNIEAVKIEKDADGRRCIFVHLCGVKDPIANNWDSTQNEALGKNYDDGFYRRLNTAVSLIGEEVCWTTYKAASSENELKLEGVRYPIKEWFWEIIAIPREQKGQETPVFFQGLNNG